MSNEGRSSKNNLAVILSKHIEKECLETLVAYSVI